MQGADREEVFAAGRLAPEGVAGVLRGGQSSVVIEIHHDHPLGVNHVNRIEDGRHAVHERGKLDASHGNAALGEGRGVAQHMLVNIGKAADGRDKLRLFVLRPERAGVQLVPADFAVAREQGGQGNIGRGVCRGFQGVKDTLPVGRRERTALGQLRARNQAAGLRRYGVPVFYLHHVARNVILELQAAGTRREELRVRPFEVEQAVHPAVVGGGVRVVVLKQLVAEQLGVVVGRAAGA